MVKLTQLVDFLNEYLAIDEIKDDAWNGLQIEGHKTVRHVATAVDAGVTTGKRAAEIGADFLLVHHGIFWKSSNPSAVGWIKHRVTTFTEHNLSLYAAHLPLDCHRVVGNNAQLLKLLGARIVDACFQHEGKSIGWIGRLHSPKPLSAIETMLTTTLKASCTTHAHGPKTVRTIAVCSGGGGYQGYFEALKKKVDLYITGDTIYVGQLPQEARFNTIFAGHYATETLGVQALANMLEKKFAVQTRFIDVPTNL